MEIIKALFLNLTMTIAVFILCATLFALTWKHPLIGITIGALIVAGTITAAELYRSKK